MPLDPIKATEAITESYLSYLSTTFQMQDERLQHQFVELLRTPGRLTKGPILEATPPFMAGVTLRDLIEEGMLSQRFEQLHSDKLPLDRTLYLHQETAIRKIIGHQRNVVVATGTGSGKTECFLIPILNHLFREEERSALTSGVRALLLYPMNALANDQLSRLRDLLQVYPMITFGRYTGETEEKYKAALDKYRKMYQRDPCPNELISRDQMRETPPHILLTNYAMLEYLLLRPADNSFFDGGHAKWWRFLVVDEAHTYNGAKGIEMAMLFRRLRDRIVEGREDQLCCIATSATLGGGERDFPDVATFASQLFSERFEWIWEEPTRQDVVQATRLPMARPSGDTWTPEPGLYLKWQGLARDPKKRVQVGGFVKEAQGAGVPTQILRASAAAAHNDYHKFLYRVLRHSKNLVQLREILEAGPDYLHNLAHAIFGDHADAVGQLVALVDLAAQASPSDDDQPLMPARYHVFARAMEGTYIVLRPEPRLYLERREQVEIGGDDYTAFEAAVCRRCGALYIVGEEHDVDGRTLLSQPGHRYLEDPRHLLFHWLPDHNSSQAADNEDEVVASGEDGEVGANQRFRLCAKCGAIGRADQVAPICECDDSHKVTVVRVPSKDGQVHVCPACGSRSPSSLVWRFLTGTDATASVLATSLYQQIPPRESSSTSSGSMPPTTSDPWSSTAASATGETASSGVIGQARQLLIFSDSRQDAAFFAPYLARTYTQILRRRLILKTLADSREDVLTNYWRVQDLVRPLARQIDHLNLYPEMSEQQRLGEAWKWVLYELLAIDRRNGLEGLGCLGFVLTKPKGWVAPMPLLAWGLSDEEVWLLFQVLLDSLRTKGAVAFPDSVLTQ